jgi:Fe-S-cluster containining protein
MPIIRIIPINLTSVESEEPIVNVPCGSCTVCCEMLSPFLTPEEVQSGLYPITLLNPDPTHGDDAGPTVALFRKPSGGCSMLIDKKCSIYDYRPLACRQFDCRKGHHPKIPNLASQA